MIAFTDTSVVLRLVFGERGAHEGVHKFSKIYASELLRVEALRALDRLRVQNSWPEAEVAQRVRILTAVCAFISFIPIQAPILRRASEPFPTIVGTLDAIHLASALLAEGQLKKPILFLTHDSRQGLAAIASGLRAEGFEGPG